MEEVDLSEGRYDAVVVGAGFAGSVIARELAERAGKKVLLIERRDHVGGNAYDLKDPNGILYHLYGPHIFHTKNERVYRYLSRFTEWLDYQHKVVANVHGTFLPVPFNKHSILTVFGSGRGQALIDKLIAAYGDGARVPIIELRNSNDPDLHELADYIYENIFLHYTMKQWGLAPEEVDPSVTARVPVLVSDDDRYFQDAYQGMPKDGYTPVFNALLDHPNITLKLSTDASSLLGLLDGQGRDATSDPAAGPVVRATLDGQPYEGAIVFTGAIDELLCRRFGPLPYRSLRFELELLDQDRFQPTATVNYTVSEDFTRITEWKQLTAQEVPGKTLITREYPQAYVPNAGMTPYYAILSDENNAIYQRYTDMLAGLPGFYLLGRLAEYRYYNMDVIVGRALELADSIIGDRA